MTPQINVVNENKTTFVETIISLCKFLLGLKFLLMVNNTSSQMQSLKVYVIK